MADSSEQNQAGSSQEVVPQPLNDGEEIVKLRDIIKSQDEMMEEVVAVLGAGDDFNCSYNQGYMKRQALYACLTCVPQGKDNFKLAAGFCLACSYHCHDGHNLIELYTKRHFRCDCGNMKFGNIHCNLDANKDDYNVENIYNQNFSGLYCICSKPYPDPDDTIEDDMIQCIICEDWYHSRHLNTPAVDDFAEMVCEQCVKDNDFLLNYIGLALTVVEPSTTDETVTVTATPEAETNGEDVPASTEINGENIAESGSEIAAQAESNGDTADAPTSNGENPEALTANEENTESPTSNEENMESTESNEENMEATESKEENTGPNESNEKMMEDVVVENVNGGETVCKKPVPKELPNARTIFMRELSWRQHLCSCKTCTEMYKEKKVEFLLDPEDTVEYYETKGKEKYIDAQKEAVEVEAQLMKSLPRAPLLDALAGMNDFKVQLAEYLKQFAEQQKVLTVEDVKEFFSKLNSNKRQKTSENTYYCR